MFFPLAGILWWIIEKLSGGEFTNELGGLIGTFIEIIFLIIYIVIFAVFDNNWIDIFSGISIPDVSFKW
jgi:hypothetical protein